MLDSRRGVVVFASAHRFLTAGTDRKGIFHEDGKSGFAEVWSQGES